MEPESRPARTAPKIPGDEQKRRLESWKEIADYFRRGVTTVQRWENEERLPIRSHDHTKKGSVYAYTGELDEWREKRERAPQSRWMTAHLASKTLCCTTDGAYARWRLPSSPSLLP